MNVKTTVQSRADDRRIVRSKAPVMEVKYPNCASIDIAKSELWVVLPIKDIWLKPLERNWKVILNS